MTIATEPFSTSLQLEALRNVDFEWVRQLKSVWRDPPYHVAQIHGEIAENILADFQRKTKSLDSTPLGQVIVGAAGSGKTHLIGTLRHLVWENGGWFVLLDFAGIKDFWGSAALCFVTSLNQRLPSGETQYQAVLSKLVTAEGFDPRIRSLLEQLIQQQDIAVQIQRETVRGFIQAFLIALDRAHPGELPYPDVVRACLLLILGDWDARNVAYGWLQGLDIDREDLRELGFGLARPDQINLVRGMSWLMSLAGPTLIAVDQIDAIVSEANLRRVASPSAPTTEAAALSIIESLAGGLMDLHDNKYRAMTVVSCLDATWDVLKVHASVAVTDRFHPAIELRSFKCAATAQEMVEARLARAYRECGFIPPYPSWPFAPEAFSTAEGFFARQLLKACDDHRNRCLAQGYIVELRSFRDLAGSTQAAEPRNEFDAMLQAEKQNVDLARLFKDDTEDHALGDVLTKAFDLFVAQTCLPPQVDLAPSLDIGQRAPLHARLTFTYRSEGDRERHYCFRALSHSNANAFQCRIKAAMTASGIDRKLPFRHLFILRRDDPPGGKVTAQLVEEFKAAGGKFIAPEDNDLRTILALHALSEARHEDFQAWLQARKPLCDTKLFREAGLCEAIDLGTVAAEKSTGQISPIMEGAQAQEKADAAPGPAMVAPPISPELGTPHEKLIPIGRRIEAGGLGRAETIKTDLLRRHISILAGSGSGKTVLLRRIIEEAALLKIPAIVLDTNNDLALLGEPWPARPDAFGEEDASKAEAYRNDVEVLVWTPGVPSGRPLHLAVLPDFSVLTDKADECTKAVEMAHATLVPFIGTSTRTPKGNLKAGILRNALGDFAGRGGKTLDELVAYLRDLPEGVSHIKDAGKLASEIADQLLATIALNPLLVAQGTPLDPKELFGEEDGAKTRVSVINLAGLPSEEARQSFVNQLQMALFTFIKKHPSARGWLYAMDEARNFAPAQKSTPCKASTLSLVAQARKYGLGMIFATQGPKDIDNTIVSNCTTHFYGKMNSPTTIDAVKELIAAKGGHAEDIAKLPAGTFYFATEGLPKPVKVATPFCLSYHPKNPPGADEVAARSRT